jgi:hypothetical protein
MTRRIVAACGAVALLIALGTVIPAALGAVSAAWPWAGLLVALASVITLRVSTVREQRARVEAAFAAAMNAERTQLARVADLQDDPRVIEERARRRREAQVFDDAEAASAGAAADTTAAQAVQSAPADSAETKPAETDSAAAESGTAEIAAANAKAAPARTTADAAREAVASGSEWEPVQVPRPTYLDAPAASRHRPAPVQPEESSSAVPSKLDLDEVLRRRRA